MLRLEHVRKSFGSRLILNIPEWEIPVGIHWIQGENGAGKSTLFRVLSGIYDFEGDVIMHGRYSVRKHPLEYRARIALAEAEPQFPGFLTPDDLLRYAATTRKAPPGQLDGLVEATGIGSYRDQPFSTCSSGMLKKVSLAMAFLGTPEVIILDEPLITIDAEARAVLFRLIREKHKTGTGFLLSSHQYFATNEIPVFETYRLNNGSLSKTDAPAL